MAGLEYLSSDCHQIQVTSSDFPYGSLKNGRNHHENLTSNNTKRSKASAAPADKDEAVVLATIAGMPEPDRISRAPYSLAITIPSLITPDRDIPPMDLAEKELYHQIHPVKLAVDIGATPFALYFFWIHDLIPALVVTLVPSVVASAILMRYADLEPYRSSGMGRYLKRYMTRRMEAGRLGGLLIMVLGAWLHLWPLIPVGILVVLVAWLCGIILPGPETPPDAPRDT